ncbi:PAS domain-containing protein [bacterium]|nr:PAS domain-containing protein [bacterium]
MDKKFFNYDKRSKYIFAILILSSIIIGSISHFAISNVQNKMDKTYANFAQLLTKTIATEATDWSGTTPEKKSILFSEKFSQLIKENQDISFIEYKDVNNKVIYSSKQDFPVDDNETVINISAPVLFNNALSGYISVGMSGKSINSTTSILQKSLFLTFALIWIIFVLLISTNYLLMSRELKKIYKGVKQISTGQFGYKLESENIAEITDAFNDMSNILSKYEEQNIEQLTLERNKLEAVLMSIINGVIVCDNFDNVVMTNSAALKMLDVEEHNIINKKIQNYIDSHGQKCFEEKIEEFKDTPLNIIENKPIEFNIEVGKKTIKSMISPMFSQMQDYVGYIIVLIDITRETEVSKLKNTFISNVSHELRTPVTVLRTYIDTLCNNGDDFDEETKKEFMNTIDTEAKRLHTMVNDILDFSRMESGKAILKKEYSNIINLIEQNINSIKILADEKNIKIIFNTAENIPTVPINVESMDRVIRNLLSNAIKYSLEGKDITINISQTPDYKNIEFSVIDNGIGIAKEHQEKIFDRFYRIENATHTIKGTGLGLHLVKMTIEEYHHGKITVESKENEGSTFKVILPLEVDETELV